MPSPSVMLRRSLIFRRTIICSLLAGFAVYGLAHVPQADAQYPGGGSGGNSGGGNSGGGGYPGGGGGYPGGYPGGGGGGHTWSVTSTQAGAWSNDFNGFPARGYWNPGPFSGGGGYAMGATGESNGVVYGTVTSTLTWTPATGKTLLTDPAPSPLFVLESADAWWRSLWGNSPSPPTLADTSGSSVADGFGDVPVFASDYTSATSAGYRLEQRDFSTGSCTVSDTLAANNPPFSQASGYPPYTKWPSGQTRVSFDPYPIVLSAPEPSGFPNNGDGTNQFVYSADMPDGYLYVPGAVQVVGGSHDDSEWLINNNPIFDPSDKIDLRIEGTAPAGTPIPNTFTHQWAVSNDTIFVNTPQDPNNPYPGYQFNHWIFKGLPLYFSSAIDGRHQVTLYVQGTKSQVANIQTFYQATASNYPQAADDFANYGYYLPNWFNYFEQAFPNTTTYQPIPTDLFGNPVTNAAAFAQCAGGYDTSVVPNRRIITESISKMAASALTIGNAPPAGRGIPVFQINSNTNYTDYMGQLYVEGIYSYLYVNAHEQEHNALQISGDCWTPTTLDQAPSPPLDTDGDWIPDSVEAKYHLNPGDPDTTGYYTDKNFFPEGPKYNNGDTEVICDIAGLHAVVGNNLAYLHDWSTAGVQYGPRPTFFPYEYAPMQISQPHSNDLPASAITDLP